MECNYYSLKIKHICSMGEYILPYKNSELYGPISTPDEENSGFDLIIQSTVVCKPNKVTFIGHKIACEMGYEVDTVDSDGHTVTEYINVPYYLVPRSSISKTPLIMANSIGIIDKGYRGEIIAAVYNTSDKEYVVDAGRRLFQIVHSSLVPFSTYVVSSLSESNRRTGGFGSTDV